MSKQIENNVVQMTFDNKDFEKNISTSSKSIEKLNEQLKFKDASEGFKDLEKYANNVNFDGLNKAINNINSVFTVTGKLAKNIVDDIAGYLENKISSAVSTVSRSINYVFDPSFGMQKYEQYTTALLSMTSNLSDYDKLHFKDNFGSELEFVEHYIETLALYADETSYSMTDMVDTMAKFAANNVDIAQSSSAMMGLANMAAVAGQNAKTATASMYQLAQAFGTGYVRYQDWAQAFTLKNIATKESKEIFLKAAQEMHTINEKDIAKAKKELGEANWMNYFFTSDSLNQGWLKTDTVLVKGLKEYSKASDLILERLDDIGDASVSEILTWADEMKKSGKSATQFVNDISGASMAKVEDVELLIDTLNKLGSTEYELSLKAFMAAQNATNFHETLEATRDAVGTKMMYALKYFIGDLDQARKLWTKFANSLWNVFAAPLDNALAGLKAWNKGVIEFKEGALTSEKFVDNYEKFWSSVGKIFTNIGLVFDGLIDQFRILAGCFEFTKDGIEGTSIIAEYTLHFMRRITSAVGNLADATSDFLESDLYQNIKDTFMYIIKAVRNTKRIVGSVFDATVGTVLKNVGGPLTAISELLLEISKRFEWYTDRILKSANFNKFIDTLGRLTAKLVELGTYLIGKFGNILLKITDAVFNLSVKILDFLSPAIEALLDFIIESVIPFIDKLIDGQYGLGAAFDWVGNKIDGLIPKIEDFTKKVFGMDFKDVKKKFTEFTNGFVVDAKKLGKEGLDKFKEFFKGSFDSDTKGSWTALFNTVTQADSVSEAAQNAIRWSGDAIMRPIQLVLDLASVISGKDLSGMSEAISKFVHSITDSLADISPNVFKVISKTVNLLFDILKYVAGLVIEIVKFATGASTTTGFALLDDFIYSIKTIFISLVEAFVYILKQLAGLAPLITPAIKKSIDYIGDLMIALAGLFKRTFTTIVNIKTPEEFLGYVKQLAKIVIALVVFIKLFMLLDDIIFVTKRFKMGFKTLKANIFTVTDSIAGVMDTIGGYGLPGMIRMFAILLASIGYALAQVAKVGQMLADENSKKGIIMAFEGVIVILLLFTILIKRLMKAQTKLSMKVIECKTKFGWGKFGNKDDNEMKNSMSGIAQALIGLGIGLVGIAAAVGILAKVANTTSSSDLYSAVAGISFMLLALGIFMKLAAAQQKSSRSLADKTGYQSNREGKFYKGVATTLIGFAVSMLLITPAIALLTHTVKKAGVESFKEAVMAVVKVLGIIGAFMFLVSVANNNGGILSSLGFIGILKAVSKLMITMAALMVALSLSMAYLINREDREAVYKILDYFTWIFGILAALIAVLSLGSQKLTWQQQLRDLGIKIAKLIFISFTLTALAMIVGAIGASVWMLVNLMKKYKFDGKVPDIITTAIYVLIGILAALTVMVLVLIKALKFDKGDWKAILARVGGMFLLLLAMSNMLVIIAGIATLMSLVLSFKRVGDNIWKAVGVLGAILGGLTLFMFLMVAIGKFAGAGNGKTNSAVELMKIAAAIGVLAGALGVMGGVLITLAKAAKKLDHKDLSTAAKVIIQLMVAITLFSLAIGAINVYFGGVITVLAGMFKVLAYIILGVVAAVILFGKYGDKIAEWLDASRPKIEAGFRALGRSMIAAIDGFNEVLPQILEAISTTLLIILTWIAYNIQDWTFYLILILSKILAGIGEALADESSELGQALANILNALLVIVMTFLDGVLGTNIMDWAGGMIGALGDLLLYSIPGIGGLLVASEKKRQRDTEISEHQHQKEMYEMRKKGALAYMEMLENLQNAENELIQASEITDEVTKAQAMRRANENLAGWQSRVNALEKDAEFIFGKYGIDVTKSADEQDIWWEGDESVSKFNELINSRDWRQAFDWNNRAGAEHSSEWYDNLNPHMSYTRKETSEESKGKKASDASDVIDLLKGKITGAGSGFADSVKDSLGGKTGESAGGIMSSDFLSGIVSGLKDKGKDIKEFISESVGGLGLNTMFGGASDITSNIASYDLGNTVAFPASSTSYSMDVPDISSVYQQMDHSGTLLEGTYDEDSYSIDQIDGITSTMNTGSEDVVNAINDQKQAYIDALAEYTQAILDQTYQIKLDNDVIAGELAPSMNKALGRIAGMAKNRGI